jgi:3-phosphoshikimate 1-carboxyvinyltransferase
VEAFKKLGADIKYLGSKGFPPIEIADFVHSGKNKVQIRGGISSQFISALMMIGPKLDGGLTITLAGKVVSKPYILLTSSLMGQFGIKPIVKASSIFIKEGKYRKRKVKVDGDWSAASYWYSLFRLSNAKRILLTGLSHHPRQGDAKLISIMKGFGVRSRPIPGGYELTRIKFRQRKIFDFIENPDLAQTIIVLCALLKVRAKFNGLDTLSIKETDRIKAIQKELSKIGVAFLKNQDNSYSLSFLTISGELPKQIRIRTYEDHRMAMAFAPLMLFTDVLIENPSVINKSYPGFWNQLESVMEFAN